MLTVAIWIAQILEQGTLRETGIAVAAESETELSPQSNEKLIPENLKTQL